MSKRRFFVTTRVLRHWTACMKKQNAFRNNTNDYVATYWAISGNSPRRHETVIRGNSSIIHARQSLANGRINQHNNRYSTHSCTIPYSLPGHVERIAIRYNHYRHVIPSSELRKSISWIGFLIIISYHNHDSIFADYMYQGDFISSQTLLIICLWFLCNGSNREYTSWETNIIQNEMW